MRNQKRSHALNVVHHELNGIYTFSYMCDKLSLPLSAERHVPGTKVMEIGVKRMRTDLFNCIGHTTPMCTYRSSEPDHATRTCEYVRVIPFIFLVIPCEWMRRGVFRCLFHDLGRTNHVMCRFLRWFTWYDIEVCTSFPWSKLHLHESVQVSSMI